MLHPLALPSTELRIEFPKIHHQAAIWSGSLPGLLAMLHKDLLLALDSSSSVFFSILKELSKAYVDFIRTKYSPLYP